LTTSKSARSKTVGDSCPRGRGIRLCARSLDATLVDNFSVKSYDITLFDGRRIQVKARAVSDPPKPGQLQTSPFLSWDFDLAALILVRDTDYEVVRGVWVLMDLVRTRATYRRHVNGSIVMMSPEVVDHEESRDITDRLRDAASAI
jgi:hypothetical protein